MFDRDEVAALIEAAAIAADALDERVGDHRLTIAKRDISGILGCEERHLSSPFEWSIPVAAGTVIHRAIELAIHWSGEPVAADLVDEAIDRLGNDERPLSEWLGSCTAADLSDLRAACQEGVVRFLESFPPIPRSAAPIVEARVIWRPNAPIRFRGQVDLVLGRPQGTEATRVLVDFKSGVTALAHGQDLRFYALLETLVRSVPPRLVASYYLAAGEAVVEQVTMPMLHSALDRALAAADALVETMVEGRATVRRPGLACRWCVLADDCTEGQAWLEADSEAND